MKQWIHVFDSMLTFEEINKRVDLKYKNQKKILRHLSLKLQLSFPKILQRAAMEISEQWVLLHLQSMLQCPGVMR